MLIPLMNAILAIANAVRLVSSPVFGNCLSGADSLVSAGCFLLAAAGLAWVVVIVAV